MLTRKTSKTYDNLVHVFFATNINILLLFPGANTGIGKATATELARRGGRVILACRDKKKGEAVANKIKSKTKNPEVYSYELDLGRQASVKEFVDELNHREPLLHVLINNAGNDDKFYSI